jgi:hypothetical protein
MRMSAVAPSEGALLIAVSGMRSASASA